MTKKYVCKKKLDLSQIVLIDELRIDRRQFNHLQWDCIQFETVSLYFLYPANMRRWPDVGLLLDQRRRLWANS